MERGTEAGTRADASPAQELAADLRKLAARIDAEFRLDLAKMAAYDRVKMDAIEKLVRPPMCASFSLTPGSVNRMLHGRSGHLYTGREMG